MARAVLLKSALAGADVASHSDEANRWLPRLAEEDMRLDRILGSGIRLGAAVATAGLLAAPASAVHDIIENTPRLART